MLAYSEEGKLEEYEDVNGYTICSFCLKIYRQTLNEQLSGFREREEDICPYCDYVNDSSMKYDYWNTAINDVELKALKKKSLIGTIINKCHESYISSSCDFCNHINVCPGSCGGNCKNCLAEVHYPNRTLNGKTDYDCERMLDFYVCDYSAKYASEMLYLMHESMALKNIDDYHVLSIGCGGAPDLMAFEKYCHDISADKSVSYIGIDVNEKWKKIHDDIKNYRTKTLRKTQFFYQDAISENIDIAHTNVLILQYVISHFYNTNQISLIEVFFDKIIKQIIQKREKGDPFVLMINDVNSNRRGRDYFVRIIEKISQTDLHNSLHTERFYFDYNIQNINQRYGICHRSNNIVFKLPKELEIYEPWKECSSAQLLVELY